MAEMPPIPGLGGAPPPGMPGAGATPPGAPPAPPGPMGGTGAAMAPRPMMGSGAQGLVLVRTGVEALQKSLLGLPMGSELHTAVLKAITEIARRLEGGTTGNPSEKIQALSQMARETSGNPQAAQLAKMMAGGGGGPAAGAGAPPPPPM